jgi:hypothetical protein
LATNSSLIDTWNKGRAAVVKGTETLGENGYWLGLPSDRGKHAGSEWARRFVLELCANFLLVDAELSDLECGFLGEVAGIQGSPAQLRSFAESLRSENPGFFKQLPTGLRLAIELDKRLPKPFVAAGMVHVIDLLAQIAVAADLQGHPKEMEALTAYIALLRADSGQGGGRMRAGSWSLAGRSA